MKKIFMLMSLVPFSMTAFAEEAVYKRCEVEGISVTGDSPDKTAVLNCYSGKKSKSWKSFFEDGMSFPTMLRDDYNFPDCSQELIDKLKAKRQELDKLNEDLHKFHGRCLVRPEVKTITVQGINHHLTLFYIALKDGVIMTDVKINAEDFVSATLKRSFRYSEFDEVSGVDIDGPMGRMIGREAHGGYDSEGSSITGEDATTTNDTDISKTHVNSNDLYCQDMIDSVDREIKYVTERKDKLIADKESCKD